MIDAHILLIIALILFCTKVLLLNAAYKND